MDKKNEAPRSYYGRFALNILYIARTPEFLSVAGLIVAVLARHRVASFTGLNPNNLSVWIPLLSPIAAQPVYSLFNRLREERDYAHQQETAERQRIHQEIEKSIKQGESAFSEQDYLTAAHAFRQVRILCQPLQEIDTSLLQLQSLYKEAKAYFCMRQFGVAEELLSEILRQDTKNQDALNLRGLIYFKMSESYLAKNDLNHAFPLRELAKLDFAASLKGSASQSDIYILYQYLADDLARVVAHMSITGVGEGACGLQHTERHIITNEVLIAYGRSLLAIQDEISDFEQIIKLFELAIATTPKTPAYIIERGEIFLALAETFRKLEQQLRPQSKILKIKRSAQDVTDIDAKKASELAQSHNDKGKMLLDEAAELCKLQQDDSNYTNWTSFFKEKKNIKKILFSSLIRWGNNKTAAGQREQLKEALKRNTEKWGFDCVDVLGDGRCLFHAVVDQLKRLGINISWFKLIDITVQHILENQNLYSSVINDIDKFVAGLFTGQVWGGHEVIMVLSRVLNADFVIIKSNADKPLAILRPRATHRLFLGNEVDIHFQSLHPNKTFNEDLSKKLLEACQKEEDKLISTPLSPANQALLSIDKTTATSSTNKAPNPT